MTPTITYTCIAFIAILSLSFRVKYNSKRSKEYRKIIPHMEKAIGDFREFTKSYISGKKFNAWQHNYHKTGEHILKHEKHFKNHCYYKHKLKASEEFITYYSDKSVVNTLNQNFVEQELINYKHLFENIEKYPLTDKQREAIVHEEDNNLVIAGAGTGKTSTIVGKVAYLQDRYEIHPEDILILSFNSKIAQELTERLSERIGQYTQDENFKIEAKTFHGFGRKIVARVEKKAPSLSALATDDYAKSKKLKEILDEALEKDDYFKKILAEYLPEFVKPFKDTLEFRTLGDYIDYLKSRYIRSLKGEQVKSYEEMQIADFLYLHDIAYIYEDKYKYKTYTEDYSQYKPDFYLPEYDIYIEHFGIGRNGEVPQWFKDGINQSATERYQEKIKWARDIHKQHKTTLIETYSYEKREGSLLTNLEQKLEAKGVEINPKDPEEILKFYEEKIPVIASLIGTFLNLYKGGQHKLSTLKEKAKHHDKLGRASAFLEIFAYIHHKYEEYLRQKDEIDFDDMILKATRYIESSQYRHNLRYIIIDEFQDISLGRYRLIKSLIDQKPEIKVFAVGDDWQSIYRFTGSDINIMTDFENFFGFAKKTNLDTTFRSSNKIAQIAAKFIQKNPNQLKKDIQSIFNTKEKAVEIMDDEGALILALQKISEKKPNASVFILSRYRDKKYEDKPELKQLKKEFPKLSIENLTIHKSKGLEADYVIIYNVVFGKNAFPSQNQDDPILDLVLAKPENYEYAEERRIFYVALTRAKYKVYITTKKGKESRFVKELQDKKQGRICPNCEKGILRKINGQKGEFTSCSNYPYCEYKKN